MYWHIFFSGMGSKEHKWMSKNGWEKFRDILEIRDLWTLDLAASSQVLPVCLFLCCFPLILAAGFHPGCILQHTSSPVLSSRNICSSFMPLLLLTQYILCSFCANHIFVFRILAKGLFLFGFICYNGCTIILIKNNNWLTATNIIMCPQ